MTKKRKLTLELEKLFKQKCYEKYGNACIICSEPGVYHHYIMKSRNGLLKYEVKNAIVLCQKHHYMIHNAPPSIIARLIEMIRTTKGKAWCIWVDSHEHKHGVSFTSLKWLEKQKEKLLNL